MGIKATATILLTEHTKELFKLMQFHQIPEEAKYVAFLEDGDACFIEEIESVPGSFNIPRLVFIQYYEDVEVELNEE